MVLDPNIILQAGRGVTPLQDPMESYGKAMSLASAMQQNQMGGLQLQQALQQQKDNEDFRAATGMRNFRTRSATLPALMMRCRKHQNWAPHPPWSSSRRPRTCGTRAFS